MRKENLKFGPPHAVLNLSKLGLRYFRLFIKVSNSSKEKLLTSLSAHPNVGWVFSAKDWFNLGVGLWAKDNAEINDLSASIRKLLTRNDKIIYQSELTSLYSFGNRAITHKGEAMPIVDAQVSQVEFTPLQMDYIKLLTMDSSMPIEEFAQILGISEQKVKKLNQDLSEQGVIVGYQERINYAGIYYKVLIDTSGRKKDFDVSVFEEELWNDDACIYFERANGKYDLEFELILSERSELKKYIKNFSEYKVSELIKNLYTNLYPLSKTANLKEIKEVFEKQKDKEVIDFRNSKFWYLNYKGAESYLSMYENKKYYEIMEKSELDLFDDVVSYLKEKNKDKLFNLIDIGSGDGVKAEFFINKLGESLVKAYYPVDVQPIELSVALKTHKNKKYAKHPTLLDVENISARFPLKTLPKEKQIYIFFGGTYGNFPVEKINKYLKPLSLNKTSILLISMPIIKNKINKKIIDSYTANIGYENTAFGPLAQAGFKKEDFVSDKNYKGAFVNTIIEDSKLISLFKLKKDTSRLGQRFKKGTIFKMTSSWKPTLDEFRSALEQDFKVEKIFSNDDMAVAVISGK